MFYLLKGDYNPRWFPSMALVMLLMSGLPSLLSRDRTFWLICKHSLRAGSVREWKGIQHEDMFILKPEECSSFKISVPLPYLPQESDRPMSMGPKPFNPGGVLCLDEVDFENAKAEFETMCERAKILYKAYLGL